MSNHIETEDSTGTNQANSKAVIRIAISLIAALVVPIVAAIITGYLLIRSERLELLPAVFVSALVLLLVMFLFNAILIGPLAARSLGLSGSFPADSDHAKILSHLAARAEFSPPSPEPGYENELVPACDESGESDAQQ